MVVALDDFAALNILALGVTPDLDYDAFGYATTEAIFERAGVTSKPYGAALSVEEVLAAEPDVIVGVSLPTTVEQKARLEKIAPTTILDTPRTGRLHCVARPKRSAASSVPSRSSVLSRQTPPC